MIKRQSHIPLHPSLAPGVASLRSIDACKEVSVA